MASLKASLTALMLFFAAAPAMAVGQEVGTAPPVALRRPPPCQHRFGPAPYDNNPNTPNRWGTRWGWDADPLLGDNGQRSVLTWVSVDRPRQLPPGVRGVTVGNGQLMALPDPNGSLVGTVVRGQASNKKPVDVAICGAEPSPESPDIIRYDIEAWNSQAQQWDNPCVATSLAPAPKALAVSGTWDMRGTHHDARKTFTFACETGAIAKCIRWGFVPWETRGQGSLADVHQACTRMVTADYCGNGHSHTRPGVEIGYSRVDSDGSESLLAQTLDWNPELATFEALWLTNGAACLAHARLGEELSVIIEECPQRLRQGREVDLGRGIRCSVKDRRANLKRSIFATRSHETSKDSVAQSDGESMSE